MTFWCSVVAGVLYWAGLHLIASTTENTLSIISRPPSPVDGWDAAAVLTGIGVQLRSAVVWDLTPVCLFLCGVLLTMVPAAFLSIVPLSCGSRLYLLANRAVFHELNNTIKLVLQTCVITFNDTIHNQITLYYGLINRTTCKSSS